MSFHACLKFGAKMAEILLQQISSEVCQPAVQLNPLLDGMRSKSVSV